MQKTLITDNSDSTKKRALRILGKRNFSRHELEKRLISKGEPEDAAKQAVQWLTELGYIDDDNYSKLIVSHYSDKGYGEGRIRAELHKRGFDDIIIRERLSEYRSMAQPGFNEADDVNGQLNPAVEFLRKKLRGSTDDTELRKAADALVRRGFSYEDARTAIRLYSDTINYDDGC